MKIVVFELPEDEAPILEQWKKNHPDVTIEALDEPLTIDNIDRAKGSDTVSLAAVVPVPDEDLDALHAIDVNVISQRSAGVDKYNLNELGMMLINVPHYSPNAIAEYVVSSALYFTRHLNNIYRNVEKHDFRFLSRKMRTLTVGIFGVGNIGRAAAKLFHLIEAVSDCLGFVCDWISD